MKGRYGSEALGYIESLVEFDKINRLGEALGIEYLRDYLGTLGIQFLTYLVDITGLYGYLGNLSERGPYLVIHESIAPATHGSELWQLIKRKE